MVRKEVREDAPPPPPVTPPKPKIPLKPVTASHQSAKVAVPPAGRATGSGFVSETGTTESGTRNGFGAGIGSASRNGSGSGAENGSRNGSESGTRHSFGGGTGAGSRNGSGSGSGSGSEGAIRNGFGGGSGRMAGNGSRNGSGGAPGSGTASGTGSAARGNGSGVAAGSGGSKASSGRRSIFSTGPAADGLVGCGFCGRNFAADRIEKHETVCQKTKSKKRKVFDVTKMRVKGTEAESFVLHKSFRDSNHDHPVAASAATRKSTANSQSAASAPSAPSANAKAADNHVTFFSLCLSFAAHVPHERPHRYPRLFLITFCT